MTIKTKEELLNALDNLDTASETELEALEQSIAETEAAIATAGSEYDESIAQTESEATATLEQYNADVQAAITAKDNARTALESINIVETLAAITAALEAIQDVIPPTITSGDPADVQVAFNQITASVNEQIANIIAALNALNLVGLISAMKEAATALVTAIEKAAAAGLVPSEDTQQEIDEIFGVIQGLVS